MELQNLLSQPDVVGVLCAVYAGLEYWLGKTERVKAGSVVEALMNGFKLVCRVLTKKKSL